MSAIGNLQTAVSNLSEVVSVAVGELEAGGGNSAAVQSAADTINNLAGDLRNAAASAPTSSATAPASSTSTATASSSSSSSASASAPASSSSTATAQAPAAAPRRQRAAAPAADGVFRG